VEDSNSEEDDKTLIFQRMVGDRGAPSAFKIPARLERCLSSPISIPAFWIISLNVLIGNYKI